MAPRRHGLGRMAVTAPAFDTLATARKLKAAGTIAQAQAEAVAAAARTARADRSEIATKADLAGLEARFLARVVGVGRRRRRRHRLEASVGLWRPRAGPGCRRLAIWRAPFPYPPRRTRAHGAVLGARSAAAMHGAHGQPLTSCALLSGTLRPASLSERRTRRARARVRDPSENPARGASPKPGCRRAKSLCPSADVRPDSGNRRIPGGGFSGDAVSADDAQDGRG